MLKRVVVPKLQQVGELQASQRSAALELSESINMPEMVLVSKEDTAASGYLLPTYTQMGIFH